MKNFQSDRKPGGFGGGSKFGGRSEGRGGFGGGARSGGYGRSDNRSDDRGGRSFGARSSFDRPPMHDAVCSECGKDCQVPFRPTGAKPVFCSNCFAENGGGNDNGGSKSFATRDSHRESYSRDSRESFTDKKMFKAVCSECGERCEVPFKPVEGKTIFCDNCFRGNDKADKPVKSEHNYQAQFEALNVKLDLILKTLSKTAPVAEVATVVEEKIEKKAKAKPAKVEKEEVVVEAPVVEKVEKIVKKKIVKK
jgi:CxxC-x17-CxxC domain-containing protein